MPLGVFALKLSKITKKYLIACRAVAFVIALAACALSIILALSEKESAATCGGQGAPLKRNVLLMGVDSSERLTDVIMLLSFDEGKTRAVAAQLPRDTYAEYTRGQYRKINGALSALGGGGAVADFLEETLKIKIDHYITVDLDGLAAAVDAVGGVEVNIPEDMIYEDVYQGLAVELKAGRQVLNGEKARQFIRYRSGYVRGDIARLDAQKIFLSALAEKMLSLSVLEMISPIQKIISSSESDLKLSDCLYYVSKATELKAKDVCFFTLPGEDVRSKSGSWYYILNKKQTYIALCEFFGCDAEYGEFDRYRVLTGTYSIEFNEIYDAESGYEYSTRTAEEINRNGIEIDRTETK